MATIAGLESIFRLSLIVNMIDNLTGPSRQVNSALSGTNDKIADLQRSYSDLAKTGTVVASAGAGITKAVLSPVAATFETKKALGELSSLGIQDLQALEDAATKFSNKWSGTNKADFIAAAYDIKSGIASLSDTGVAEYTRLSALTGKATKASVDEMTSLFATGYGIYKDFYSNMTDIEFGEMFSAGISKSVQQFKTTGSQMSQAIETLGASATTAKVPLEEQLSILGMLQATMSGSEAGTKYRAFIKSAASAGEKLGLSFMDANNQLLSMPEILSQLKGKFGETMDAAEKIELQKAFGRHEAVALIDLLYSKTGQLEENIVGLHSSMSKGTEIAQQMADTMNQDPGARYELLLQQVHNVKEQIGNGLLPVILSLMTVGSQFISGVGNWISEHQTLTAVIMRVAFVIGLLLTAFGSLLAMYGIGGMVVTKSIAMFGDFRKGIEILGPKIRTLGSSIGNLTLKFLRFTWQLIRTSAIGIKNFVVGLYNMARQAVITGVQALPGLIASVWGFTAALLANPVTWVVVGIIALAGGLYLLWKHFDQVAEFVSGAFNSALQLIGNVFNWVKEKITNLPGSFKLVLAAIFPFIALPMLIINNWDKIAGFFTNLLPNLLAIFGNFIVNLKNKLLEKLSIFKDSGKKIMETLGQGIVSGVTAPFRAVKDGLAKIRNLLPFSDAKEGPLSELTLSGRKVFQTMAAGMKLEAPVLAEVSGNAFAGALQMPGLQNQSDFKINVVMPDTPDIISQANNALNMPEVNNKESVGNINIPDLQNQSELNLNMIIPETPDSIQENSTLDIPEIKSKEYTEKLSLEKESKIEKVNLREIIRENNSETKEIKSKESDKGINVERLNINLENVKDIQELLQLIEDLRDYVESSTDEDEDEEL